MSPAATAQEQDFILSAVSPGPAQKSLALGVVLLLTVALLLVAGPLSTVPLQPIPAFIPGYAAAMLAIDSITAVLLYAQFSILRSRALLVLASGYLFTALMAIPWTLTFPGVLAPRGLLGAGASSTSWLYTMWHTGFPAFVIAYALMKDREPARRAWRGSLRTAIFASVAGTAAAVIAATILATAGQDLLPPLQADPIHYSPFWANAALFASLLIVLTIATLWRRRTSTLDLWLIAVMWAFLVEIGLVSFPVAARYTVGWYAGRICGAVSGSLLLIVLLYEITHIYARLHARLHSELQRSESFLAEAQSISSTGSFGWNVLTREVSWSEETYRIFEQDRAVAPTLALILERIHPDDRQRVQQILVLAAQEGKDFDFEHRLLMRDGSVKHLHVLARAARTAAGELEFVGAVADLTRRKRAEEKQAQLEQRLRQAETMEVLGQFAGGIAHDFNNVLASIVGYGERLLETTTPASPTRQHAQSMLAAADRGRALVEQILVYSRSQHGRRAAVDVRDVVSEGLDTVRGALPANISVDFSTPASPLAVLGDSTRLYQIVMNLCSNAVQAMAGGGILRVTLAAEDLRHQRRLSHGILASARYARLTVADDGCGMDEATLARIFEPFFTTRELGQGTGLGLSIVEAIVADTGGAMDVQSTRGQGTTFAVYLPLVGSAAPVA